MANYVWLVTGASSGFGKSISLEALKRGYNVIATARNSTKLSSLKTAGAATMDLDVTSDDETLASRLAEANAIYGKITHVVNCAGYLLEGAVEEATYAPYTHPSHASQHRLTTPSQKRRGICYLQHQRVRLLQHCSSRHPVPPQSSGVSTSRKHNGARQHW